MDRSFNSSKSDKLPSLDTYFDGYFKLQQSAVEIISDKAPKNKFLEDYLTTLPGLEPEYFNPKRLLEQVQPLITIASNNGFEFLTGVQ